MMLASLAGRGGEGRSWGVGVLHFGARWWLVSVQVGLPGEDDGGPGAGWWFAAVGFVSPVPERDELGECRRPMQLNSPDPSRRRWWFLRLTTPFGKGLILLHGFDLKTMVPSLLCCIDGLASPSREEEEDVFLVLCLFFFMFTSLLCTSTLI